MNIISYWKNNKKEENCEKEKSCVKFGAKENWFLLSGADKMIKMETDSKPIDDSKTQVC